MNAQHNRYEKMLDDVSQWMLAAVQQDTVTAVEIVTKAKAYVQAAEDLSKDEIALLETYIVRDFAAFADNWQHQANRSMWWQTLKHEFWQLLGSISDKHQLQWFEMHEDIAHQGLYRSGELVAIGELVCSQCGQQQQVDHLQTIVPCMQCGNPHFYRQSLRA